MRINTTASKADFSTMPDMPATDKQRNYIATLMDKLGWHSEEMACYAHEQGCDLMQMTVPEASALIEGLKRLVNGEVIMDLPQLGGALAKDAPPSLFDEATPIRPIRKTTIHCAVCGIQTEIPILANGKLCDLCRIDLPLCRSNIAADLATADRARVLAWDAWIDAHGVAGEEEQARFSAALGVRRTGVQGGKRFTTDQVEQVWAKLKLAGDAFAVLLCTHDQLEAAETTLDRARAHASCALEEIDVAERG